MTLSKDYRQRFVFDELDVRGCIVRLAETCEAVQATHHYPQNLAKLLNQFALSAALLRDSIKIQGSLTIQLRTPGAIKLMMADCMADRKIRAIAEYEQEELAASDTLALNSFGEGAVLAITITPEEGERYQSIVPIEHASLADCLADYFERSEQLPSSFKLLVEPEQGVGIVLHALPAEKVKDPAASQEHFKRLNLLLDSMAVEEALSLDSQTLLTRLFHEESCRLFDAHPVQFGCVCSAEKSLDAIRGLGQAEVVSIIEDEQAKGHDVVTVDCHFCFQRYEFPFAELNALFN